LVPVASRAPRFGRHRIGFCRYNCVMKPFAPRRLSRSQAGNYREHSVPVRSRFERRFPSIWQRLGLPAERICDPYRLRHRRGGTHARACRSLQALRHLGRWSRTCRRSQSRQRRPHRRHEAFRRRIIPGNRTLDPHAVAERVATYHAPLPRSDCGTHSRSARAQRRSGTRLDPQLHAGVARPPAPLAHRQFCGIRDGRLAAAAMQRLAA
jgi:hypothetical protein